MSKEIWDALKKDCKGGPFSDLKFTKRGDKYYVSCSIDRMSPDRYNGLGESKFRAWIKPICDKYGWAPYMTSGSTYEFTYRLNGDPLISHYAYL